MFRPEKYPRSGNVRDLSSGLRPVFINETPLFHTILKCTNSKRIREDLQLPNVIKIIVDIDEYVYPTSRAQQQQELVYECHYEYIPDRYVLISDYILRQIFNKTEAECNQICNVEGPSCTFLYEGSFGVCSLFTTPIIYVSMDTNLTECEEKCNEKTGCLTMSSWGPGLDRCYLFNVNYSEIPEENRANFTGDTISMKMCI
ncbi:hypothetical protein LOTGIDRAFT_175132 [Lottia gigantea]|uniref:Apple domain-containing protein n=1 Tax=Lottia gigantea TaxID=225164 RepID=V4C270_LOTGI|nr:hypothetical protein LOTGIDRAFT_175132 [Lottia gigantea]ESO95589.1 hypothetical protein LOTGIDRAFT_175132 [Lottia gigantea]